MNFFDLVFVLALALFLVKGWFHGVSHQFFAFIGLGLAFLVAEQWLIPTLEAQSYLSTTTGINSSLVYLGSLGIGRLIGQVLFHLVKDISNNSLDKSLPRPFGLLFSLGQVFLFNSMLLYLFKRYFPAFSDELNQSLFLNLIAQIRPFVGGVNLALFNT